MKIGLIGYTSKLGRPLVQRGLTPLDCDITKRNSIERVLAKEKPDLIVNLASKSSPDWVESNYDEALNINVYGFVELCRLTYDRHIPVVALSTDHIFSGKTYFDFKMMQMIRKGPYKENYPRSIPVNAYGITKLGMETVASVYPHVKVVRTSYVFDEERLQFDMDGLKKGYPLSSPTFLHRSFMYLDHFVEAFSVYLNKFFQMFPITNISGSKTVSWHTFMLALADVYGFDKTLVVPRNKDDMGYAARPHKAGLDVSLSANLGIPQFDYLDGLRAMEDKK